MLQEEDLGASFYDDGQKPPWSASNSTDHMIANPLYTNDYGVEDPWSTPSVNHGPPVENVLGGVILPVIYDSAWKQAAPSAGKISVTTMSRLMDLSGLQPSVVDKIFHLVIPPSSSQIHRNQFNVVLGLVALAQKNMDVSIENLRAHRDDLPHPVLSGLQNFSAKSTMSRSSNRRSIDSVADPWRTSTITSPTNASTPVTKGLAHASTGAAVPSYENVNSFARTNDYQWHLETDLVKVTLAPEREGFLLFKHAIYILDVEIRGVKVSRRYSDFWWLMEVLQRRYPYRLLPSMPPKKVGVDDAFLERRRKGLSRFINFIVHHPILKDDDVVTKFLTLKEEMASYRRMNPPDLTDEFTRRKPPVEALKSHIPVDLEEKLLRVRRKLSDSLEHYQNMCHIMERIVKRNEGAASDYIRYNLSLKALIENEKTCHEPECANCPQVSRGFSSIAAHMQTASAILENKYHVLDEDVLEGLKKQRDFILSLKELFERKDRLEGTDIDNLKKYVNTNQEKLDKIRNTEGQEAERERLTKAIENDQREINNQKNRAIFIRYCMHTELSFFHCLTAHISIVYQNFVTDQIKFSEQIHQNWKNLAAPVYDMPNDPSSGFG